MSNVNKKIGNLCKAAIELQHKKRLLFNNKIATILQRPGSGLYVKKEGDVPAGSAAGERQAIERSPLRLL